MVFYHNLKEVKPTDFNNKTVALYLDLNVPISSGTISDTFRLEQCLETIRMVSQNACNTLILSHLGRPDQKKIEMFRTRGIAELTLAPVFEWLERNGKSNKKIVFVRKLEEIQIRLTNHPIVLLENTRLYDKEELEKNIEPLIDLAIYDAFSCAHRPPLPLLHRKYFIGPLIRKELDHIHDKWDLVLMGGKKIEDKLKLIRNMRSNRLVLGSKMGIEMIRNGGIPDNQLKEYLEDIREIIFLTNSSGQGNRNHCSVGRVDSEQIRKKQTQMNGDPKYAHERLELDDRQSEKNQDSVEGIRLNNSNRKYIGTFMDQKCKDRIDSKGNTRILDDQEKNLHRDKVTQKLSTTRSKSTLRAAESPENPSLDNENRTEQFAVQDIYDKLKDNTSFWKQSMDIYQFNWSSLIKKYDLLIPVDYLTDKFEYKTILDILSDGSEVLDIGPITMSLLQSIMKVSKNIFWNGPFGMFENDKCVGTRWLVELITERKESMILVGGGETAMAVRKYSNQNEHIRISTGGGALLTLMSGVKMKGLEICEKEDLHEK